MVGEVWNDTVGQAVPDSDVRNPLKMLGTFSGGGSPDSAISIGQGLDAEETICSLVIACNAGGLDGLANTIVEGVADGSMDPGEERELILGWMQSRYNPSRARATISVWVSSHDE
jgi:hypothetical protein